MKPEAVAFLVKSQEDLDDARKILAIGLAKVAARSAYYAMFHAAEAYIFENTGRVAKRHSGVRSEFARLARADMRIPGSFAAELARGYKFKELGDYMTGEAARISGEDALALIDTAERFLAGIRLAVGAN